MVSFKKPLTPRQFIEWLIKEGYRIADADGRLLSEAEVTSLLENKKEAPVIAILDRTAVSRWKRRFLRYPIPSGVVRQVIAVVRFEQYWKITVREEFRVLFPKLLMYATAAYKAAERRCDPRHDERELWCEPH